MTPEPKLERAAREAIWPYPRIWRAFRRLHPVVQVVVFSSWLAATATLLWMGEFRPYDLWSMNPATRAPADLKCDRWVSGHALADRLLRGEEVRILAEKRSADGVDWIRIGRKAGGACWMDRYYWDEAAAQVRP